MTGDPRVLPVGDAALTVELGDTIDPDTNARVRVLDRGLLDRPFPGFVESVPAYRSVLVCYDPGRVTFSEARGEVLDRIPAKGQSAPAGKLVVVPTVYDGEDLDDVARLTGLTPDEVARRHGGREYTAFMVGFAPGFAYLGLLDQALATARRATPRVRVPAGSVAVTGRQTAIYPGGTAGGWNLIGRTSVRLFDPATMPPCLILPGDRVRFEPVAELREDATASTPRSPAAASAILEVLDGGLLTTAQDLGRPGHRRFGVSGGGAVDPRGLRAANAAVGNETGAAALECTIAGPRLRFLAPARFALAGADLGAVLERSDLGEWPVPLGTPVLARAGNVLGFRERRQGCRGYLGVAGGLDLPLVLGSRSTDLTGGFGGLEGRALRAGDTLGLLVARGGSSAPSSPLEPGSPSVTLRVVLGPQREHFDEAAIARFLSSEYSVLPTSDRVATRLSGATVTHRGPGEIVSDGMVPGSVQVPPDGQPIVMLADAPTTGGYPKIATVITADLPLLAQLVPGEGRVRFEAVSVG